MRTSLFPILTLKETPSEAELISHQLMLRAGLIRRLASGLYTWLPLGLKVVRKVEQIVREEMNASGALELLMPSIQPAELWQESGRWEKFGPELLRLTDRHDREFCVGPTHEEVITDLVRREIRSYKQLPINFYQIQTKFRDETRPRFGVMRSREFIMKDAYSFHIDSSSLDDTYQSMYQAYSRIFTRLNLEFRAVQADTGAIGGNASHEFHVLAQSGEDAIAFCPESGYAANVELAKALVDENKRPASLEPLKKIATPNLRSVEDLSHHFSIPPQQILKTLIVRSSNNDKDHDFIALVLRGDHELNPIKAEKIPAISSPLVFATEKEIQELFGADPGSLGPRNAPLPVIVDQSAAHCSNFVIGANENGFHWFGTNWHRDLDLPEIADLRTVQEGDKSPDGQGRLTILRGIEVGHIFKLGSTYSKRMGATVLNESGSAIPLLMGCYGIGITRIVAASIEQQHDEKGIIWPETIAPFTVAIVAINAHKSELVRTKTEALYQSLQQQGHDVLWDDRPLRPGVIFSDLDLIGIPYRLVVSDKSLQDDSVELKDRKSGVIQKVSYHWLQNQIQQGDTFETLVQTLKG